jgi:hypothetical protein
VLCLAGPAAFFWPAPGRAASAPCDLVSGLNTLEMLPLNAPMDYPPAVANIDLTLASGAAFVPTAPTNLRIVPR